MFYNVLSGRLLKYFLLQPWKWGIVINKNTAELNISQTQWKKHKLWTCGFSSLPGSMQQQQRPRAWTHLSDAACLCCLVTLPILTFSKTKEKNHLIQEVWRTTLPVVEKCFEWIIPFSLCHSRQKHISDSMGVIKKEGKTLRTNSFCLCACTIPARLTFHAHQDDPTE